MTARGGVRGAADTQAQPNRWQRIIRSGPGQAIRWLVVLALVLGHWLVTVLGPITGHGHWLTSASLVLGNKGNPGTFAGWVPVIIISLVLLLPDADSIAFGGVKLEMRRVRDEVTRLTQQIEQRQSQGQVFNVYLGQEPQEVEAAIEAGDESPSADLPSSLFDPPRPTSYETSTTPNPDGT